jgi:hypothetical protein
MRALASSENGREAQQSVGSGEHVEVVPEFGQRRPATVLPAGGPRPAAAGVISLALTQPAEHIAADSAG